MEGLNEVRCFLIGIGSNSILGGPNVIYTVIDCGDLHCMYELG